jgi:hypothetical protein
MRMSTGEYVIFVAPTALQLQIFRELLKPETVQAVVRNSGPGGQSSGGSVLALCHRQLSLARSAGR